MPGDNIPIRAKRIFIPKEKQPIEREGFHTFTASGDH